MTVEIYDFILQLFKRTANWNNSISQLSVGYLQVKLLMNVQLKTKLQYDFKLFSFSLTWLLCEDFIIVSEDRKVLIIS